MAALASDWLRHFLLLLWNCWTEFNETDWKQDLNVLYQVCVFRADRKNKMAAWPLIGWDILDFSSETAERNSTKLNRKLDLNVLYQVCVFRADQKNKMATLASDWPEKHKLRLWLLLLNRWTEFNETWQEARSQRPLQSLCFLGLSEKQHGGPGLWLAETFSTSPLKPLNGHQRNLIGSKITTSSTKFVFFGPIRKTRWPPWPLIGWDIFDFSSEAAERNSTKLTGSKISTSSTKFVFFGLMGKTRWPPWPFIGLDIFDFSSETAERNSTKLDRKLDLNFLYQVCVFRADWKNKMATLASDWLRHFRLFLWNSGSEFNKTWQEARSQRPLPSLCFSGRSKKTRWPPWPLIGWDIFYFSSETAERNSTKLTGSKISTSSTTFVFFGRIGKTRWPPGLLLAETFWTSPLKPLNWIQRNLTGSKISMSSTKFVFFRSISKQKCPLWLISQRDGTLYSGARYVALCAPCLIPVCLHVCR